MNLPNDMDKECIGICNAINLLDGIQTVESCCGHGDSPFMIWITMDDPTNCDNNFALLLWALDKCHSGVPSWRCTAYTDCIGDAVRYRIESESVGEEAYAEAIVIATLIKEAWDEDIARAIDLSMAV